MLSTHESRARSLNCGGSTTCSNRQSRLWDVDHQNGTGALGWQCYYAHGRRPGVNLKLRRSSLRRRMAENASERCPDMRSSICMDSSTTFHLLSKPNISQHFTTMARKRSRLRTRNEGLKRFHPAEAAELSSTIAVIHCTTGHDHLLKIDFKRSLHDGF